jgi:mono/diheme cytochrome c family protein
VIQRGFVVKFPLIAPIVALAALGLAGCGQPPAATFSRDERTENLIPEARDLVDKALTENFGAPNQLVAWKKFPIDYGNPDPQADPTDPHSREGWRLIEGRNLYMTHCQHCHGVSGDGKGPTSRFLNPRPRDYRQGTFKFKSTLRAQKPSRKDLVHILEQGIPGTYMPSFVLLGDEKLGLIVDYVRWLSIRGNTEIRLATELAAMGATKKDLDRALTDDEGKNKKKADIVAELMKSVNEELPGKFDEATDDLTEAWASAEAEENVVVPKVKRTPPTKESIEKGRAFFLSLNPKKKTECVECHGKLGRGDGPNTEKYWPIPNSAPERKYEVAGLHDEWGFPQTPRNLARGIYRGGRRPIDIFRRVHEGIPGTQMAGFATVLTDEEIWDLVNYVLSVPFEGKHSAYPTELDEEQQGENKVATTSE